MNMFSAIILIGYMVTLAVLALPVHFRVNRAKYIAQLLSFPLLMAGMGLAVSLVGLICLVITHAIFWGLVVLFSVIYALVILYQAFRLGLNNNTPTLPDASATDLVIMGWNTLGDSVSVPVLRDAILLHRPDAVALPETTKPHQEALTEALMEAGYPMLGYTVGPQDGHAPHETSLLIKREYGHYNVERLNVLGASTLEAVPADPTAPTFVAVHTVAPTLQWHASWQQDLRMLAHRYRGAKRTILVGDFNATVVHMRALGQDRMGVLGSLVDSAEEQRSAIYGTWPADKPALLGTQIDHVLHSLDYEATEFGVLTAYDDGGSDHRAILARLANNPAGNLWR